MAKTRHAYGPSTSLAAALALVATGCAVTARGTEEPAVSATRVDASAAGGGCRENADWTPRDETSWLRPAVSFSPDAVVLKHGGGADEGEDGPLCAPVTVQVEFWKLTARAEGTDVVSVHRTRLRVDGRGDHTVDVPTGLTTHDSDTCTGVLVVVNTGTPLSKKELPENIALPLPRPEDLEFRSERIVAHEVLPPSDPARCGAAGAPSAKATATPEPWGSNHP